jgi:hypothetical protein
MRGVVGDGSRYVGGSGMRGKRSRQFGGCAHGGVSRRRMLPAGIGLGAADCMKSTGAGAETLTPVDLIIHRDSTKHHPPQPSSDTNIRALRSFAPTQPAHHLVVIFRWYRACEVEMRWRYVLTCAQAPPPSSPPPGLPTSQPIHGVS